MDQAMQAATPSEAEIAARLEMLLRLGPRPTMAEVADLHYMYEISVQSPDEDVEFFADTFKELRGRDALILKEDFCGTAKISVEWTKLSPLRRAIGVDLDGPTLEWGLRHNVIPAGQDVAQRVHLIQADVRDVSDHKADLVCSLNYSSNVFKTRDALRQYFIGAFNSLVDDGVFFLELFGGSESMCVQTDCPRDFDTFTYEWEQAAFNPATHAMTCHINFSFPDGSALPKAFSYDWRFWTPVEIREVMLEAGFTKVKTYWGEIDDDGVVSDGFIDTDEPDQSDAWLAYVVALK
eukprot:TRINITY_DN2591_c0_g2_i1.p1 TRINITY_DN2591_c0_g2~~TRINITY_DN2591_c0_g2_i1.p1  ORF type:complete len:293 (-),score=48.04 TRINITY_DN2591_c0_g2_i1:413-1291(-)